MLKSSQPFIAFVALGSNLGDRHHNMALALEKLACIPGCTVVAHSGWIETQAVGMEPDTPCFLNGVAKIRGKGLSSRDLLAALQQIERETFKRGDKGHNRSRAMDLDLLLYNEEVCNSVELILPHPRLHQRRFVLEPLSEVAPNLTIPTMGKSVIELLISLSD